jgi:hypothetical protein
MPSKHRRAATNDLHPPWECYALAGRRPLGITECTAWEPEKHLSGDLLRGKMSQFENLLQHLDYAGHLITAMIAGYGIHFISITDTAGRLAAA